MTQKAQSKLALSLKLARECSRDSWQCTELTPHARQSMRQISRESIADARYWRSQL